jgi:hypothetical protein
MERCVKYLNDFVEFLCLSQANRLELGKERKSARSGLINRQPPRCNGPMSAIGGKADMARNGVAAPCQPVLHKGYNADRSSFCVSKGTAKLASG